MVAVMGPKGCGKSTLIRSLVKSYTGQSPLTLTLTLTLTNPNRNPTVIRSLTLIPILALPFHESP